MSIGGNRLQQQGIQAMISVLQWPPLVYYVLGFVLLFFWALGTSVQVLTSEAWMMHKDLKDINFTAFSQIYDAATGHLSPDMLAPFMFGWGVQFALMVASIGIELPRRPLWRFVLAWALAICLLVSNSCGDFAASSSYGFWGQIGFTAATFFMTFCMLLFAILSFQYGWRKMRGQSV